MEPGTSDNAPISVAVDLNVDESAIAPARARQILMRRAGGRRDVGAIVLFGLVLGLVGALAYESLRNAGVDSGYLVLAAIVLGLAGVTWLTLRRRRRVESCYLESLPRRYAVTVADEGLTVSSDDGLTTFGWQALRGVEAGNAGVMLLFSGHRALWIPQRCFDDEVAREAFAARIAASANMPVGALGKPGLPEQVEEQSISGSRAFLRNLKVGCGLLLFRPAVLPQLTASAGQFVALIVAGLAVELVLDLARVGWQGSLNPGALPVQLYGVPWLLLAAWGAWGGARKGSVLAGAVAMGLIWLIVGTLLTTWAVVDAKSWAPAWLRIDSSASLVWMACLVWATLASIVALVREFRMPAEDRLAAVMAVLFLLVLPLMLVQREDHLWVPDYRQAGSDPEKQAAWKRRQMAAGEATLYAQNKLLEEALAAVKPGVPGKPELFLIAVGGDGSQDVFRREVASVSQLFAERFGTAGHSLALVNNPDTVLSQPIASVTALRRAVRVMGQRMNPDEDVLFLFMTSHGSQDHRFYLNLWPYKFDELTPTVLRAMLDEAGVKYRVVVVSACYSGGFVPPLAGDNTLVISASRADRNSHGCSHEAEWTFFGKAYFDEALRDERSFEAAFADAAKRVASREAAEDVTPSEPQIAVGEGIRRALKPFDGKG